MFPNEFAEGMTARALKLGDVGASAPENWPEPFDRPERIHLIATIYAERPEQLDGIQQRTLADGNAFRLLGTREGHNFLGDFVHFGYRDNIMQPRFEGITTRCAIPTDNRWLRLAPCCWDIRPTWKV